MNPLNSSFKWLIFGKFQLKNLPEDNLEFDRLQTQEFCALAHPFEWVPPKRVFLGPITHSILLPGKREGDRRTGHVLGRTDPLWVPNLYAERHWGTNWWANVTSPKLQHRAPERMPHGGSQDDAWANQVPVDEVPFPEHPLSKMLCPAAGWLQWSDWHLKSMVLGRSW